MRRRAGASIGATPGRRAGKDGTTGTAVRYRPPLRCRSTSGNTRGTSIRARSSSTCFKVRTIVTSRTKRWCSSTIRRSRCKAAPAVAPNVRPGSPGKPGPSSSNKSRPAKSATAAGGRDSAKGAAGAGGEPAEGAAATAAAGREPAEGAAATAAASRRRSAAERQQQQEGREPAEGAAAAATAAGREQQKAATADRNRPPRVSRRHKSRLRKSRPRTRLSSKVATRPSKAFAHNRFSSPRHGEAATCSQPDPASGSPQCARMCTRAASRRATAARNWSGARVRGWRKHRPPDGDGDLARGAAGAKRHGSRRRTRSLAETRNPALTLSTSATTFKAGLDGAVRGCAGVWPST